MKKFKNYFYWKSLSSIGDEMWSVIFPLFLSLIFNLAEVGYILSALSVGSLLGFAISSRINIQKITSILVVIDGVNAILFLLISILIYFRIPMLPLWFFITFIIGFIQSLWFAWSEVMIANLNDFYDDQVNLHSNNVFSQQLGALMGPLLGGILVKYGMFLFGAVFNSISFIGQMIITKTIVLSKKDSTEKLSFISNLIKTLILFKKSKLLIAISIIPIMIKILLLGSLPFVLIILSKLNYSLELSLLIPTYAIGAILATRTKISKSLQMLQRGLIITCAPMFICIFLNILNLVYIKNIYLFFILFFILGFTATQYTIQIRTIRQLIVKNTDLISVISIQALLARVLTPVAGILFGSFLLSSNTRFQYIGWGIFIIVYMIGCYGYYMSAKNNGVV